MISERGMEWTQPGCTAPISWYAEDCYLSLVGYSCSRPPGAYKKGTKLPRKDCHQNPRRNVLMDFGLRLGPLFTLKM